MYLTLSPKLEAEFGGGLGGTDILEAGSENSSPGHISSLLSQPLACTEDVSSERIAPVACHAWYFLPCLPTVMDSYPSGKADPD